MARLAAIPEVRGGNRCSRTGVQKNSGGRPNDRKAAWEALGRVRYRGLSRNACHLQFVEMAMNMKRALVLLRTA
jgi:hypothetical protein